MVPSPSASNFQMDNSSGSLIEWKQLLREVDNVKALALLPSIYSKEKPHFKTSILMAICLFIITVTNLTLNLWLGAAGTFANVVMWMILAFQKLQKKQR